MKSLSFVLIGRDDRSSISEEPHRGHRKISGAEMGYAQSKQMRSFLMALTRFIFFNEIVM